MPECSKQPLTVSKTDLQKVVSYLSAAARLYDAPPMPALKCRAYMIRQLAAKLKSKIIEK